MMVGLSEGFTKELVLNGVGYRAQTDSGALTMNLGYSHIVGMTIPKDIQCTVTGPPTPSPQPHAAKPPSFPSSTHLPARWPDPPRCCRPFALLVFYSSPHAHAAGSARRGSWFRWRRAHAAAPLARLLSFRLHGAPTHATPTPCVVYYLIRHAHAAGPLRPCPWFFSSVFSCGVALHGCVCKAAAGCGRSCSLCQCAIHAPLPGAPLPAAWW